MLDLQIKAVKVLCVFLCVCFFFKALGIEEERGSLAATWGPWQLASDIGKSQVPSSSQARHPTVFS